MGLVAGAVSAIIAIAKCTKPVKHHVSYLFRFNINGEDLGKAKKDVVILKSKIQEDVERAALNTEVVEEDVKDWLQNVEEIVKDVVTLESKIQENKVCCNGWCPNLIQRYKQNKEAAKKTTTLKELKDACSFTRVAHRAPTPGIEIFSSSNFEEFESRKSASRQIMEALGDDNCSRIGVWGMGGVGKTTLVKEVYKKAKALGRFNDIAMAVVSQTPDIRKIQNEITGHLKNFQLEENDDSERARRMCLRIKKAERILIILDDIWKEVNFEDIGIPSFDDHKGCKILITTRSEHVCNVMSCEKEVQLKMMTEEESLTLFKKSARIDDGSLAINDAVVREVVKECQGLPIAIVAVGKTLIKKSLHDWKATLQHLRNSKLVDIEGVDEDKNAYVCLKWSYDHLKRNTKLCFLLCSLFPEDHYIPIEELTRYAIGLEVCDDVKSIEEGRRLVHSLINTLKASSLLLGGFDEEYVKMHDMVRDVALWIASKGENEFSLRICTRLENMKNIENDTAISLWANNTKNLPEKLVCPKLNFLSLGEISSYQLENIPEISDSLLEGMKELKVLSLRNKFLSSQSLQFLTNLRCLYLVNCNFDDLSSLGKLKSLEILNFHYCKMVALPNELGELNNLKVLDLLRCHKLKRIPPNLINALSQLEELYICESSFTNWELEETGIERNNASLSELISLSNLAMLSLTFVAKSLPNGFVFLNLQRYEIFVCGKSNYSTYNSPQSRVIRINGVDASSLNAFKELFCTVEDLLLKNWKAGCFIDTTGGNNNPTFSNLVKLQLNDCSRLTNLSPSLVQNLEKLETLILESCSALKQIISEEEMLFKSHHIQPPCFPKLRILKVVCCRKLEYLFSPSFVQNLEKLETLIITGCSELKQIISEEEMLFKSNHIQPPCFPKLRVLKVTNCERLEYLFSISVAQDFLLQLEELKVSFLPELMQVFGNKREGEVGLDENKFELSKLRKLRLENLPNLSNFFLGNISSTWPSLEWLLLTKCPKLTSSVDQMVSLPAVEKEYVIYYSFSFLDDQYVPVSYSKSRVLRLVDVDAASMNVFKVFFCTVEQLVLKNCEMECFSDTTRGNTIATFSNLVKLELYLPSMRTVWEGPIQQTTFRNLTFLEARNCSRLTNLFSPSIVQNLEKLETLILERCSELKQIISEEEILFTRHDIQCFPKLRILKVIDCEKLEYLFSISVARDFIVPLEELIIGDLLELKQVFGNEREGEVGLDENKFELSKLRKLSLQNLPELRNFFQGNNSSTWASLDMLSVSVTRCPTMTPFFVANLVPSLQAIRKGYVISNGCNITRNDSKPRDLRLVDVDASTLDALKVLFYTVEELQLEKCEVECFNDTTGGNNTITFSNLVVLIMKDMPSLRTMWEGPIQQTTFHNLKILEARSCNRMSNLFSPSLVQNLKKLETLILERCSELKQIISGDETLLKFHHYIQPPCFPKLRILKVIDCEKLEYLFSISVARGFVLQVEELRIDDLPELKQVFGDEREGEVGLDENKFELSKLRELNLKNLPKLSNLFQGNTSSTWPSLEKLSVMRCPKTTPSFVADMVSSLHNVGKKYVICIGCTYSGGCYSYPNIPGPLSSVILADADAPSMNASKVFFCTMEELQLEKCEVECFNDTTGGNNTITFSNLVVLRMKDMPSLRTMWEGPIQQTTFHNLKFLEARSCNRMSNLFSPSLVQNLKKLETLILERCSELKQIISGDETLLKCHHYIQPPCFPKLRILKVIDCEKLEYLFSISVARGFVLQLEELRIDDLPELKQVFGDEREGEVGLDENKFELSKLRELNLQNLPKLSNLFQGNTSSTWPSLEKLSVMRCPKMTPSFVADMVSSLQTVEEKYTICSKSGQISYSNSKVLILDGDDASSLNVLKVLFSSVELLELSSCEIECFNDTTGRNNIATFSNLVNLTLRDMPSLRTLWEGTIQHTTFCNLTFLRVYNCSELTNPLPLSLSQNLKKLETIVFESCSKLKQIILEDEMLFKCHIQPKCFPKLRTLEVINCRKLEYLCSIFVARHFLLQLKELKIDDLPELKQVLGNEREADIGLDGDKFELSELTKLSLHKLPKLSSFCQGNISSTWPSLERLSVMSCPKMTPSFGADLEANAWAIGKKLQVFNVINCSQSCNTVLNLLTQGLLDLEELKIESCGGLEDLFLHERLLPSSRLKILSLKDVLVQKCVWKGPTQLINLNNLKEFKVCQCNKLRHLFSPATIGQSLQQLESLTIEECDELEHLVANDEEDQILAESHLQPLYFPKLRDIVVKECNNMKSLFPISIARCLQQLKKLNVEGASQLVEVFAREDEGDVGIRKDIKFPRLWLLTLKRLPSLVSLCPRTYHFILQSLQFLKVLSCPNMSTSFAGTPNCIVHVNGEVPQMDEKYESAVLSATCQVPATSPTNKDIDWNKYWKFNALPLFKEQPPK